MAESWRDMATYLMANFAHSGDHDVAAVIKNLVHMQQELARLTDDYSAYVTRTICSPCKNFMQDVEDVEALKRRYDDKRQRYDMWRSRMREKSKKNSTDGIDEVIPHLEAAKAKYEESVSQLSHAVKSVEFTFPRTILTANAQHHAALTQLFAEGHQHVSKSAPLVVSSADRRKISRELPSLADGAEHEGYVVSLPMNVKQEAHFGWDAEAKTFVYASSGNAQFELQDLPPDWQSLLASLDSKLAEMNAPALEAKDAAFVVQMLLAADDDSEHQHRAHANANASQASSANSTPVTSRRSSRTDSASSVPNPDSSHKPHKYTQPLTAELPAQRGVDQDKGKRSSITSDGSPFQVPVIAVPPRGSNQHVSRYCEPVKSPVSESGEMSPTPSLSGPQTPLDSSKHKDKGSKDMFASPAPGSATKSSRAEPASSGKKKKVSAPVPPWHPDYRDESVDDSIHSIGEEVSTENGPGRDGDKTNLSPDEVDEMSLRWLEKTVLRGSVSVSQMPVTTSNDSDEVLLHDIAPAQPAPQHAPSAASPNATKPHRGDSTGSEQQGELLQRIRSTNFRMRPAAPSGSAGYGLNSSSVHPTAAPDVSGLSREQHGGLMQILARAVIDRRTHD
eukprot:jgi/Chlat1/4332/Chrsp29S04608